MRPSNQSSSSGRNLRSSDQTDAIPEEQQVAVGGIMEIEAEIEKRQQIQENVDVQPVVQQQQPQQEQVPFYATAFLHPTKFSGNEKPTEWSNEFQSWVQLQHLSQERAINAFKFFMTGTAKIWFDGLPTSSKKDVKTIIKLLEIRFRTNEDDDILCQQWASKNILEYLDRLFINATEQEIPEKPTD